MRTTVLMAAAVALLLSAGLELVPAAGPGPAQARELTVERIRIEGNTRSSDALVLRASGLRAGMTADADSLLSATARLRASGLFRDAELHTEPGSAAGAIVVRLEVEEPRPHFRLGLGYEDLSGWYLIPLQLHADNLPGHGERFRLSSVLGFRVAGLRLAYERPDLHEPRDFWGLVGRAETQTRVYFEGGTEIAHPVRRGRLDARLGRALSTHWSIEGWLAGERVRPDSTAEVYVESRDGRPQGEEIPFDALPAALRRDLHRSDRGRVGAALLLDSRTGRGLDLSGTWARVAGEWIASDDREFGSLDLDARGYLPVGASVLAARLHLGWIGSRAPFYERLYLGGLYTLRGYPSQSLSPPEGNDARAGVQVELRVPWVGPARDPVLAGLLFLDLGQAWDGDAARFRDIRGGAGWGVRVRVPWLGRIGLDVGHPLSDSPVEEAFHANLGIGWTF